MRVHLIYDVGEGKVSELEAPKVIQETSGIYQDVDVETESRKLRADWERNSTTEYLIDTNILIYHT
jgi:hypothetical protein